MIDEMKYRKAIESAKKKYASEMEKWSSLLPVEHQRYFPNGRPKLILPPSPHN